MRNPFLNRTFSTAIFYIGWIVCLQEVSKEHSYYGLVLVVCFLIYFLYYSTCLKADSLLLFLILLMGPLSDITYAHFGLLQYHSMHQLPALIPPLWVFVLWGLFGANLHLFSWLRHRLWLAVFLGAVGGPASYFSVVKLGGVSLLKPLSFTMATIGGVWAVFFPFLIWLNEYLMKNLKT